MVLHGLYALPAYMLFMFVLPPASMASEGGKLSHFQSIIHIHSNFSSGKFSIPIIAGKARAKGIKIVFFSDHDIMKISYGLPPFSSILKISQSYPSIISTGPEKYLEEIAQTADLFPDMVLIPGVESTPFYRWEGSPINKDLKVVDWRKHLLLLGSEDPKFYEGLPITHNFKKSFKWNDLSNVHELYIFFVPLLIGIFMLRWEKPYMVAGVVLIVLVALAVGNFILAGDTLFSPYREDAGLEPYQKVIDYAGEHGVLTYWAHPESNLINTDIETSLGTIGFETPRHPEDLLLTTKYTGFEAMYRDVRHLTDPGKEWDMALTQYMAGKRSSPPWGIAGIDYHGDRKGEEEISDVITVLMMEELNKQSVMETMREGRIYSLRRTEEFRFILDKFQVMGARDGEVGVSGDQVKITGPSTVEIIVVADDGSKHDISVDLIRNGDLVKTFKGVTPFEISFINDAEMEEGSFYYRIDVKGPSPHRIISNPIFVDAGGSGAEN